MLGRRFPDGDWPTEPYGYAKQLGKDDQPARSEEPGNLTGTVWVVAAPLGDEGGFMLGTLTKHTVREEDDGTISVRPGDGSSNSILITRGDRSWHGYIEHGVWQEC